MGKTSNLEKVIGGLEKLHENCECVTPYDCDCHTCPYESVSRCDEQIIRDALILLKAQEPMEPIYDEDNYIRCGQCKHNIVGIIAQDTGNIMPIQRFCAECGRAVKWE